MIFADFLKAVRQLSDPRFLRVALMGAGLALLLLAGLSYGVVHLIGWLVPGAITLPWIGEIGWADDVAGWGALGIMLVLSVFLMVPVASVFTGFFLDDVADAVEAKHYPALPEPPPVSLGETLKDSVNFLGVLIAVNIVALIAYLAVGPFGPVLFWAVNGYLLGREYFQMVAMRRIGRAGARALRRRYRWQIWLAGALMAAPLTLPLVSLIVPVLGVATFTHIFHRLNGSRATAP